MQILDILRQSDGGRAIADLADQSGADRRQFDAVLGVVVPEMAARIDRNAGTLSGLADLVGALGSGHHADYLADSRAIASDAAKVDGRAILGHVLGDQRESKELVARAAERSGMSIGQVEDLLPRVAALVMGGLAEGTRASFADVFEKLPEVNIPGVPPGGRPLPWPAGQAPGDSGGYGRAPQAPPASEPGGTWGGGPARGQPLPIPDDGFGRSRGGVSTGEPSTSPGDNPYGDLADILRKAGGAVGGGGILASIIRSIIGAVLGTQSKGMMSWIVRAIVMRYGWSILRSVLGRMLRR